MSNKNNRTNLIEVMYQCIQIIKHWETVVTKKSVVFVPLYTLCGKLQNCTESLQVMYIVTKQMFVTFYHLITNNRFVTMHKL